MQPDALRSSVFQTIIEPLVVAKIESLLLELPLQVPICFRDQLKPRMRLLHRGNDLPPILGCRVRSPAAAPGSFEDRIDEQHRHVASHTVALLRDAGKRRDGTLSQT